MRAALNYPEIDKAKLERVKTLIDCIAEKVNSDCSDELDELSQITGKNHEAMDFAEYWGWTDLDSLAKTALTAEPPCIRDLTRDEIEEIVVIVKDCFLSGEDAKGQYYEELLHKSLSLPNVIGFIMSEDDAAKIADNMIAAATKSVILL